MNTASDFTPMFRDGSERDSTLTFEEAFFLVKAALKGGAAIHRNKGRGSSPKIERAYAAGLLVLAANFLVNADPNCELLGTAKLEQILQRALDATPRTAK